MKLFTLMNRFALIVILVGITFTESFSQIGSSAGGFTRLGFGARGQGMGNAMSAITTGTIASHYNPALPCFQEGHVFYGNYSILSLDRKLNQVSYTQNLAIRKKGANHFVGDPDLNSIIGISAGWINAGDANIQGRDDDGFKTQTLSVFENQFYFTLANRFSDHLAVGLNFKFLYSGFNVYSVNVPVGISSSGFGVDAGILYILSDQISVALIAQELVSKYQWDTSTLYGSDNGKSTEDPFVRRYRAGASYQLADSLGVLGAELEYTSAKTFAARIGGEVKLASQFTLRAGIDNLPLNDSGLKLKPTAGFTVHQPIGVFSPSITYAIIFEPIAPSATHVISFALLF